MRKTKKNLAQKKNTIFVAPYNRSCNLCGTENSVLLYVPQGNWNVINAMIQKLKSTVRTVVLAAWAVALILPTQANAGGGCTQPDIDQSIGNGLCLPVGPCQTYILISGGVSTYWCLKLLVCCVSSGGCHYRIINCVNYSTGTYTLGTQVCSAGPCPP